MMTSRIKFSVEVIVCLALLALAFQSIGLQSPATAMTLNSPLPTVTAAPSPLPTATPPVSPLPTPLGLPKTGQASISALPLAVLLIALGVSAIAAAWLTKKRHI